MLKISKAAAFLTCALLPLIAACRNSDRAVPVVFSSVLPESTTATSGCNGPDQTLGQLIGITVSLPAGVQSLREIAGARDDNLLYASAIYTTGEATILELDFDAGTPTAPVVTDLLTTTSVSDLLGVVGEFGGLTVWDSNTVVVVEASRNVLLGVARSGGPAVVIFAGVPTPDSSLAGLVDGPASFARFSLDSASQLAPAGDGRMFIADTDNHAIRLLSGDPLSSPSASVSTLAGGGGLGQGLPGFADGSGFLSLFDAPTGLTLSCPDRLVVTERGDNGVETAMGSGIFSGQRLREIFSISVEDFGQSSMVASIVGDGTAASADGTGTMAQVNAPAAVVSTSTGELYWVDSGSGSLRRQMTDMVVDTAALTGTQLMAGMQHSLAISMTDALYVLEFDTGGPSSLLYRVDP